MKVGDICSFCKLECTDHSITGVGNDYSGVDPCLGVLPGVRFACCGHGFPQYSYVMFDNDMVVRNFLEIEVRADNEYGYLNLPAPRVDISTDDGYHRWLGEPHMNHFFNNWIGLLGFPYDESLWNPEVVNG